MLCEKRHFNKNLLFSISKIVYQATLINDGLVDQLEYTEIMFERDLKEYLCYRERDIPVSYKPNVVHLSARLYDIYRIKGFKGDDFNDLYC